MKKKQKYFYVSKWALLILYEGTKSKLSRYLQKAAISGPHFTKYLSSVLHIISLKAVASFSNPKWWFCWKVKAFDLLPNEKPKLMGLELL